MRFLLIFCFLLLTTNTLLAQNNFEAKKGVLDLRKYNFDTERIITLDGEWEFYWNKLLTYKTLNKVKSKKYLEASKNWTAIQKGKPYPSKGYATYHLKILLPQKLTQDLSLGMPTMGTAYNLYLNDKLLHEAGKVAKNKKNAIPKYTPKIIPLNISNAQSIDLIIQVSNYHHRKAGMWESITLGLNEDILQKKEQSVIFSLFLVGSILIMAFYHFGLFALLRKDTSTLFFGLSCLTIVFRVLATNDYLINQVLNISSFYIIIRVEYISVFLFVMFFTIFVSKIFPEETHKLAIFSNIFIFSSFCLLDIILPVYYTTYLIQPFQLITVIFAIYGIHIIIRAVFKKRLGARVFLVGLSILIATMVNDLLHVEDVINTGVISGYGFFIFIFSQAFLISQRFSIAFKNNLIFSKQLDKVNQELEQKVEKRTKDLKDANEELKTKNAEILQTQEEILTQRDFLNEQNFQLQYQNKQIQSSIKAAEAIQQAILPYEKKLERLLKDYFIINRPKDVVSGDFYWINEVKDKIVLVVADCTGHGVPGAFMTLIGHNILDKIVRLRKITNPALVLAILNEEIQNSLRQQETGNNNGMDAVILTIEKETKQTKISFSGAKNSLFYFDSEKQVLEEIKGSRKSIGGLQNIQTNFESKTIYLPKNSIIYLGSDGLEDQNNLKRKKFGKNTLMKLLADISHLPLEQQKQAIEIKLEQHMQDTPQRDDILWMGFTI